MNKLVFMFLWSCAFSKKFNLGPNVQWPLGSFSWYKTAETMNVQNGDGGEMSSNLYKDFYFFTQHFLC